MLYKKFFYVFMLGLLVLGATGLPEVESTGKDQQKCCCNDPLESLYVYDILTNTITGSCAQFKKLCTKKMKTECLFSDLVITDSLSASHLCAESILTENLCAQNVLSETILSDVVITNTLITTFFSTDNYITSLRAYASNRVDFDGYILGTDINFDTIIADENGNVSQNPTTYTAPRSGFYAITAVTKTENVNTGIPPTLNGPMSEHIDIFVNGVSQAQTFNEFNRIRNLNRVKIASLTSLLHLNKDDQVTFRYFGVRENLLTGEYTDANGTATLMGSPLDNATFMIIHYLSSDM